MWEFNVYYDEEDVVVLGDNFDAGVQLVFPPLTSGQAAAVIAEWPHWYALRDSLYDGHFADDYTNKFFGSTTWEIAGVKAHVEYSYPSATLVQ